MPHRVRHPRHAAALGDRAHRHRPFMRAEHCQRETALVSRTILLSTLGSLASLSLLLVLLGH